MHRRRRNVKLCRWTRRDGAPGHGPRGAICVLRTAKGNTKRTRKNEDGQEYAGAGFARISPLFGRRGFHDFPDDFASAGFVVSPNGDAHPGLALVEHAADAIFAE